MFRDDPWWGLPGPAGFVSALVRELRSGRNVVPCLPRHAPPGLARALADRLRDDNLFGFRPLDLAESPAGPTVSPAALLHDRFAPLTDPLVTPSARTVAFHPELEGTVVWVSGVSDACWPAWSRFLEQYKDACRLRPEYVRCLLVVPLVGKPPAEAPPDDVTLAVQRWEGVVRRFDMFVYVHRRFEQSKLADPFRELATAVTVEVAGTDPILADRLVESELPRVIEPHALLTELAGERGWSAATAAWHHGSHDRRDGKPFPHSAAECVAGRASTVSRRVWRGQVAVLYPLLEDLRHRFVGEFRSRLTLPHAGEFGTIHHAEALELAHLCQQLRYRLPARRIAELEACKRIRNELAHLRPLKAADLLAPEFLRLFEAG